MRKRSKPHRDTRSASLFPELPDPPPGGDLAQFKGLRRPVWTEQKAKLIARYLKFFTYVTRHGTYIDGFAGRQSERAESGWAAELVLANSPWRLRRLYLCDNDPKQVEALQSLKERQPPRQKADSKREVKILDGDFNDLVVALLTKEKLDPATFCLIDQRTFECRWATVERLARHRETGPKIELFYFLPIGWLNRAILATTREHARIEAWWGQPDWKQLVDMQHHEKARAFERRLAALGYEFVHAFPILDSTSGDRVMFYMILASDHPEAPKLMWRAYDQAVHDEPGWEQIPLLRR